MPGRPDATARRQRGSLPPVGNTVDVENANWTNTIGTPDLSSPRCGPIPISTRICQPAFYYARIMEIPTPRWVLPTTAVRLGADIDLPDEMPTLYVQERAYTSPIWFTP